MWTFGPCGEQQMAATAPTGLFRVSRRGRRRRRKKEEEGVYLNKGVLLSVGDVWGDIRTQFHVLWAGSFTTLIRFVPLVTLLFGFPEVFFRVMCGAAQNSWQHSELKSSVTATSLYISAVDRWIKASCECFLSSSVSSDVWMMDHSSNNSVTEFQQLWGRWNTLLDRVHDDPRVTSQCLSLPGNQSFACQLHLHLPLLNRYHSWWTQGLGSTWAATLS